MTTREAIVQEFVESNPKNLNDLIKYMIDWRMSEIYKGTFTKAQIKQYFLQPTIKFVNNMLEPNMDLVNRLFNERD